MRSSGGNTSLTRQANNLNEILHSFHDSSDEIKTFNHSPYIDIDGSKSDLLGLKDKFTVLSINIQGLNAKFDMLSAMVATLRNKDFIFCAICIQ